ncbi:MAG TPA: hypothetical protein VJN88_07330 [Ktedonobacterales bacterium]|nr:hypothetical protein [Ktedonobacterales bacterium]
MIQVTVAGYRLRLAEDLSDYYEHEVAHADRFDAFALEAEKLAVFSVAVSRGHDWPFLIVAQRYHPASEGGFFPGVLLVPETEILFIGAGERLLAYSLREPTHLWEDKADIGFWHWQRHEDVVIMSAEVELAAWDLQGKKLWTTFVEPPWEYRVEAGMVQLYVMGTLSDFPLHAGPH